MLKGCLKRRSVSMSRLLTLGSVYVREEGGREGGPSAERGLEEGKRAGWEGGRKPESHNISSGAAVGGTPGMPDRSRAHWVAPSDKGFVCLWWPAVWLEDGARSTGGGTRTKPHSCNVKGFGTTDRACRLSHVLP